jgi:ATP synthase protein I
MMMKNWKGVGSFGTLGLEVVVAIVLGLLGGRWLDRKFDTAPYLALVGFFFGVATATKAILRAWKDMQRETEREEREEGNPAPLFDAPSEADSKRESLAPDRPNSPEERPDEEQR